MSEPDSAPRGARRRNDEAMDAIFADVLDNADAGQTMAYGEEETVDRSIDPSSVDNPIAPDDTWLPIARAGWESLTGEEQLPDWFDDLTTIGEISRRLDKPRADVKAALDSANANAACSCPLCVPLSFVRGDWRVSGLFELMVESAGIPLPEERARADAEWLERARADVDMFAQFRRRYLEGGFALPPGVAVGDELAIWQEAGGGNAVATPPQVLDWMGTVVGERGPERSSSRWDQLSADPIADLDRALESMWDPLITEGTWPSFRSAPEPEPERDPLDVYREIYAEMERVGLPLAEGQLQGLIDQFSLEADVRSPTPAPPPEPRNRAERRGQTDRPGHVSPHGPRQGRR